MKSDGLFDMSSSLDMSNKAVFVDGKAPAGATERPRGRAGEGGGGPVWGRCGVAHTPVLEPQSAPGRAARLCLLRM
jgi:hypothetical protein